LIVRPDNTYEVKIDNKRVEGGELESDWDFLAPKKVKVCMFIRMFYIALLVFLSINNHLLLMFPGS